MWSLLTLVSVARVKMQTAMVMHALVREAAGGLTDEGKLRQLASGYAQVIGMPYSARQTMTVTVGCRWLNNGFGQFLAVVLPLPYRVSVSVAAPVPDAMRILTGPVRITCTNDIVVGTWKDPWNIVLKLFGL